MEQAINKFLQLLEKQEKKGFKDLATLLARTPSAVFQVSVASSKWEAAQKQHLGKRPR